jgi:hypothetical protein
MTRSNHGKHWGGPDNNLGHPSLLFLLCLHYPQTAATTIQPIKLSPSKNTPQMCICADELKKSESIDFIAKKYIVLFAFSILLHRNLTEKF